MDDDLDLPETGGDGDIVAPAGEDVENLKSALAKANKEALEARLELKRVKLEKEYGEEIVGLIPATLPQAEWGEMAEKLKAFRGQPSSETTTDQATQEGSQEEPTEDEQRLAAVSEGSPPTGASPLPLDMTAKEILELGKTDRAAADRIIAAKYRAP